MESVEAPIAWYYEYEDGTGTKQLCLTFTKPTSPFAKQITPLYTRKLADAQPQQSPV